MDDLVVRPATAAAVPVPLARGRSADVFALDGQRVLRRYRDGGDVAAEAAVMAYVAALGFPVPTVYQAQGTDLVLVRLDGPTLLAALRDGRIGIAAAAEVLADLHTRLHALPARLSRDPAARVLHLDLHPDNVILTASAPVVIDWRNAGEGPPDLDVALTALVIAQVAVGLDVGVAPAAARLLLAEFLARVGGDPLALLDRAVALRAADPNLTGDERAGLDAAADLVRECGSGSPAPR